MGRRNKFDGKMLKELRKKTPFSQLELAQILGVSRETVSAIENEKPGTIDNISIEIIRKWHEACQGYIDATTEFNFKTLITKFFGF